MIISVEYAPSRDQLYDKLAYFPVEDINLNTRVFLWPSDMEDTIDITLKTLNTKKTMAEDKLRNTKTIFEEKLKAHEKELELFRRFDPPLLNLDLLKETVAKVDEIQKNLTVSNTTLESKCTNRFQVY